MRFGRALIDSDRVVKELGVAPGMFVADFGCGRTGHISLPASRLVGNDGKVFAVDIVKNHLKMLDGLTAMAEIRNVRTIWGDYERKGGVSIPSNALDYIFFVNNLTLLDSRTGLVEEVKRLLKPDGKFVVIDWKKYVPHPIIPTSERLMNLHDAELMFTRLGFRKVDEVPISMTHWGLVLA